MPSKTHYRVVILGSGPAGLTAAVYASRAELHPLVVEGGGGDDATDVPGGQLMLTTEVDNYPGFPEGVLGPELMDRMRKQAERFGAEFATGELKAAAFKERPFRLTLASGEITADTVIVATGARAKWLNLPEELEFRTKIGGSRPAPPATASSTRARRCWWWAGATPPWRRRASSPGSPRR